MDILTQAPVSTQDALFIAQDFADLAAQGLIPEPDPRPEPTSIACPLCQGTGAGRSDYDPQTGKWDSEECHGCGGVGLVYDLEEFFSLCDIVAYLGAA